MIQPAQAATSGIRERRSRGVSSETPLLCSPPYRREDPESPKRVRGTHRYSLREAASSTHRAFLLPVAVCPVEDGKPEGLHNDEHAPAAHRLRARPVRQEKPAEGSSGRPSSVFEPRPAGPAIARAQGFNLDSSVPPLPWSLKKLVRHTLQLPNSELNRSHCGRTLLDFKEPSLQRTVDSRLMPSKGNDIPRARHQRSCPATSRSHRSGHAPFTIQPPPDTSNALQH